jgi:hypothetical protein
VDGSTDSQGEITLNFNGIVDPQITGGKTLEIDIDPVRINDDGYLRHLSWRQLRKASEVRLFFCY